MRGHLNAAFALLENRPSDMKDEVASSFFGAAFDYFDVISALSLGISPLSTEPQHAATISSFPVPEEPMPDVHEQLPLLENLDALLGLASLWPILRRLSGLRSIKEQLHIATTEGRLSEITALRTELESNATTIQADIESWRPVPPQFSPVVARDPQLRGILRNSLAYKQCALVYLHRSIYEYPQALVQTYVHQALLYCAEVAQGSGPLGAMLWPLFVAGCEAASPEDRDLTEKTFRKLKQAQGMMNIERAWLIVQKVWCRMDEQTADSEKPNAVLPNEGELWRTVMLDLGYTIILG